MVVDNGYSIIEVKINTQNEGIIFAHYKATILT